MTDTFHILSAAAGPRAVGGTQLWISKRLETADGPVDIVASQLKILYSDPQVLYVRVLLPGFPCRILVAHAPTCVEEDKIHTWWRGLGRIVQLCTVGPLFSLLDANARIGSVLSPAIHGHQAETETFAGSCFHDWLIAFDLWCPQSFHEHHIGPSATWTHSSGSTARLDFVVLDEALRHHDIVTRVSDIDLTISREDHFGVEATIPVRIGHFDRPRQVPRDAPLPQFSAKAFAPIPWSVDVHTHAARLHHDLKPFKPRKFAARPRKLHLSSTTWNLIRWKSYHLRRSKALRLLIDRELVRVFFNRWKLACEDLSRWLSGTDAADARALRRLLRRAMLQEKLIHHVACGYQELVQICQQHGVHLADPPVDPDRDALLQDFGCPHCPKRFSSLQGMRAHVWRAHGRRTEERAYMDSATCLACGRCYWSPRRLQQHLHRSRSRRDGCFAVLARHLDPLDVTQPLPIERPDSLAASHALPFVQSFGPSFLPATTAWERQHTRRLEFLRFRWDNYEFPETIDADVEQEIFASLGHITSTWIAQHGPHDAADGSLVYEWLSYLEDATSGADAAFLGFCHWGQRVMYDFLDQFDDPDVVTFIETQFLETVNSHPMWELLNAQETADHAVEPEFDQQLFLQPWTAQRILDAPGPRPLPLVLDADGRLHLYILHLFSGRRRSDDCEVWAHRLIHEFFGPEVSVHVIAVDTAIHPDLCNVLGASYENLQTLCSQGVFALMLTGPPCETWTAARHLPPAVEGQGPRPLRSAARPWGLPLLELPELRQLDTGSRLFLRSAALELRTVLAGGGSVMEHPMTPEDESYASVWRTEVQLGFLGQLYASRICGVYQYQFGAGSVKPTNLRAAGLDGFLRYIHEEKDQTALKPDRVLEGYDYFTKSYRTASAKEYPGALCRGLIRASFRALAVRRHRWGDAVLPIEAIEPNLRNWLTAVESAFGLEDEYEICRDLPACTEDRDCSLAEWDQWSDCSCSCYGVKERHRRIQQFAKAGRQRAMASPVAPWQPVTTATTATARRSVWSLARASRRWKRSRPATRCPEALVVTGEQGR
eukprot:Skav224800  [mRNA]  locus=scaffold764:652410:658927:- [translate_table: standard]